MRLCSLKTLIGCLVILLQMGGVPIYASMNWQSLSSSVPSEPIVNILSQSKDSIIIEFQLLGFYKKFVEIDGEDHLVFKIPGMKEFDRQGYPLLPYTKINLAIHNYTVPKLEILQSEGAFYKGPRVIPSKGPIYNLVDFRSKPLSYGDPYTKKQLFPLSKASLSPVFSIRGQKGITLSINPLQFDPHRGGVVIHSKLTLKISTAVISPHYSINEGLQKDMELIYSSAFSNYKPYKWLNRSLNSSSEIGGIDNISLAYHHTVAPVELRTLSRKKANIETLLLIVKDDLVPFLTPFTTWKKQRGFNVITMPVSEIGNNQKAIKGYIQGIYDTIGLKFVVLVGDHDGVATHRGTAGNVMGEEADPLYTLLEGDDSYPDIFISRLSVNNQEELESSLARLIAYEKNPEEGGLWYKKATLIASADQGFAYDRSEASNYLLSDLERAEQLYQMLISSTYNWVDRIYGDDADKEEVFSVLDEGRGVLSYTGHGLTTNWETTEFGVNDIDKLNNGGRWPFIVSVGCVNGDFGYSFGDAFAEKWLKSGTKENPLGAVAIFASSTNQSWIPPTIGQKEIFKQISKNLSQSIGEVYTAGSVAILKDNSWTAKQTFQSWHIFGDASLQIRTKTPESITLLKVPNVVSSSFMVEAEKGVKITLIQGNKLLGVLSERKNPFLSNRSSYYEYVYLDRLNTEDVILTLSGFNKVPIIIKYNWDADANQFKAANYQSYLTF